MPEPDWPLTDAGHRQAAALARFLQARKVEHLYASPFLRARQTLQPTADAIGAPVHTFDDLRERRLAGGLIDDFVQVLRTSFADEHHCLPGGESMAACRTRVGGAIRAMAAAHPGQCIAACSHGVAISAFIGSLDPAIGFDFWQRLQNPHLIRLDIEGARMAWTEISGA